MQSGISKNECDAAKECNCTAVNNGHNGFQRGTKTIESVTKEKNEMGSRDGVGVFIERQIALRIPHQDGQRKTHMWALSSALKRAVKQSIPLEVLAARLAVNQRAALGSPLHGKHQSLTGVKVPV